ncbi:carbon-nitrogen hydrolase [Flagelloscypha sp. PMI_526]|nr:carbon-nitrogen hydrolase [Flagelloscypha sp. PMI_526]
MPQVSETLRVGAVQFIPTKSVTDAKGNPAVLSNLSRMLQYIDQASKSGVQLLVFPELGVCGYNIELPAIESACSHVPQILEAMTRAAEQYKMRIIISYPTLDTSTSKRYITSTMISPAGKIEIEYHKTHLWSPIGPSAFEPAYFSHGPSLPPSIPIFPDSEIFTSTIICWDIEFPEPARVLRLQTPGHWSPLVLAVPTANADPETQEHILRTRALENHVFIVYANHGGPEFCGKSCIIAPDGKVLGILPGSEEGLLVYDIDIGKDLYAAKREVNPFLDHRRPELYGLVSSPLATS